MQRMTRQRAAIVETMAQLGEFRSAQQLHDELAARGESIGLATVYRNLQVLLDQGEVDMLRVADENLYRRCAVTDHHHHLVCRSCGRTVDFQGDSVERLAQRLGAEHGFEDVHHTLELSGLCPRCAKEAR